MCIKYFLLRSHAMLDNFFLLFLLLIAISLLRSSYISESCYKRRRAHRRITDKLVIEKKLIARASHVRPQRRRKGLHPGLTTSATFGPTERTCNYAYRNRYDLISLTRY